MNSLVSLFAHLFALALLSAHPLSGTPAATDVFVPGDEGYFRYRIPAVIRAANGDLLAFCEGRKLSGDDHGDVDLVMKRSTDNGRSWGPLEIIWDDGANTCGNPCPVLDRTTGTLWLLLTHNLGGDREQAIMQGRAEGSRTVWLTFSTDHGRTWAKPTEVTSSTKDPRWGWYATGPGVGIQVQEGTHAGRLLVPCNHSYLDLETGRPRYGAHVIYSDDHGKTWRLGGAIRPDMNEAQVVELFDGKGSLLINMRSYAGRNLRAQAISTDSGLNWSSPRDATQLVDSVCQGSIIRHASGVILFSNPASATRRVNLTVRASSDHGETWHTVTILAPGPSAYSCLVCLSETEAGCLFERGRENVDERISFARFTVPQTFSGGGGVNPGPR